jgi:hypothetical protein
MSKIDDVTKILAKALGGDVVVTTKDTLDRALAESEKRFHAALTPLFEALATWRAATRAEEACDKALIVEIDALEPRLDAMIAADAEAAQ